MPCNSINSTEGFPTILSGVTGRSTSGPARNLLRETDTLSSQLSPIVVHGNKQALWQVPLNSSLLAVKRGGGHVPPPDPMDGMRRRTWLAGRCTMDEESFSLGISPLACRCCARFHAISPEPWAVWSGSPKEIASSDGWACEWVARLSVIWPPRYLHYRARGRGVSPVQSG